LIVARMSSQQAISTSFHSPSGASSAKQHMILSLSGRLLARCRRPAS
jgi:hypothetical protein